MIKIRLSEELLDKARFDSGSLGLSLSEYLRRMIISNSGLVSVKKVPIQKKSGMTKLELDAMVKRTREKMALR